MIAQAMANPGGQRSSGCVHLNKKEIKNLTGQEKKISLFWSAALLAFEIIFRAGQENCACFSEDVK